MDLQLKSDYPNIRILMDIVEMLEDARLLGCKYYMSSRSVTDNNLCLYVEITAIHSPSLSRQIRYSTNCRSELERLSGDIQALICSEKKAQTENNQDLLRLP